MTISTPYRGRLAPSPTGQLHLGVARTALLAWLHARQARGTLVFRVEDLDAPRVVPGAAEAIAEELRFLGLHWDEGFQAGGDFGPYLQSQRRDHYEAALAALRRKGLLFDCSCSRREVAEASRAPHGDLGPRYPGTCRNGPQQSQRPLCVRFAMPDRAEPFADLVFGPTDLSVRDDFVVQRADGLFAYQLAVVVDDAAMGITDVVRGADLLSSTPHQLALYRALGLPPPRFAHVPLVLGTDGQRLAKRQGSVSIAQLRAQGAHPQRIVGALGASLGLCPPGSHVSPSELLAYADFSRLPQAGTRIDNAAII